MSETRAQQPTAGGEDPEAVAYVEGLATLQPVLNGFDLAGLVRGSWRLGVVAATSEPATAEQVAERCGTTVDKARLLLTALLAHGVVEVDAGSYVVAEAWRPLLLEGPPMTLATVLRYGEARSRMVEDAVTAGDDYWAADLSDQAAYSAGLSLDPESAHARALMRMSVDADPELRDRLQAGCSYLELGCGAGGAICALLQLYPRLTSTGIELSSALVHVARARAERLGIADRFEVVLGDAVTLDRPASYDLAFWSQFFFTEASCADTLATMHRSLRPGGLVTAPLVGEPVPADALRSDAGRAYAVDALLHGSWGVPERSAEALQQELVDAGFTEPRVLDLPLGRMVRAVRP